MLLAMFSPPDGEAAHAAEPLQALALAAEGHGGHMPLSAAISCQQHPAVHRPRDADAADGGHPHAGDQPQGAPIVEAAKWRSRRGPDATGKRGGVFALYGQQLKTKLRTDLLPQIPLGPQTRDKAERLSVDNGAAVDAVHPTARHVFRVSGYSGGVSAVNQHVNQHANQHASQPPPGMGSSNIGTIKPMTSRPQRPPPMQRSASTARPTAAHGQETVSKLDLSAVAINVPQGAKAALDSCRVPLDLSSLKGEEDGLRKINRSMRALCTQRGEPVEQDAWRSGNVRQSDSANEQLVCNSQKVEETDLVFMSQFESGNLLSAQRVGPQEYDLQLQVDNATSGHTQWFFFCVSNTFPGVQYRLNIINFAKPDSLYTRGQQPLFFSLISSKKEKVGWRRIGRDIRYYRNGRKRNGKALFTLSFLVEFAHAKDKCLFAHCYPYTYTELQDYIAKMLHRPLSRGLLKSHILCTTLGGNECNVLTITSPEGSEKEKQARKVIFVSSRVHPGESNSSWIMKGLLDFLLGPSAEAELLRHRYIFKVVPMLNPDGVVNGHYRCNLAGYDLNRHWHDPDRNVHPTIFHAKELLRTLQQEREVCMFCDIHGHSVKHNLFLYGCPKAKEDSAVALLQPDGEPLIQDFPNVLNFASPFFSMADSRFVVEKVKEHTGRVVAWRELGIANSFTLEASLCGSGEGKSQCAAQFTCADFEAMGRSFGVSLALASSEELFQSAQEDPKLLQTMLLQPQTDAGTEGEEVWSRHGGTQDGANQTQPSAARVCADSNAPSVAESRSSAPHSPPGPPAAYSAPDVSAAAETEQSTACQTGQNITSSHTASTGGGGSAGVDTSVNTTVNTSASASSATTASASASASPRKRVAALNNKTGPWLWNEQHASEVTPARDTVPKDSVLCVTPIVPTHRYQQIQQSVSRQAQTAQWEAQSVPKEMGPPVSTSMAAEAEDESSSDDERNEDDDAAGCVCVCVCACVCMYIHIHTHIHARARTHTHTHTCLTNVPGTRGAQEHVRHEQLSGGLQRDQASSPILGRDAAEEAAVSGGAHARPAHYVVTAKA